MQSQVTLNELEKSLRERDAIMEPGILIKLKQYVIVGGKPATAIDMLSENYTGAVYCCY